MMSDVLLSLASRAVHSKTGMLPFSTLEKYANNKRLLNYSQAGSDFNEIKNPPTLVIQKRQGGFYYLKKSGLRNAGFG